MSKAFINHILYFTRKYIDMKRRNFQTRATGKMKLFLFTLILCLSCTVSGNSQAKKVFWTKESSPEKISSRVTANLLGRPDFMIYHTDDIHTIHYAEVCTAFGAARIAGIKKDTALLIQIEKRYRPVFNDSLLGPPGHVDINVYGILPFELYKYLSMDHLLKQGKYLADQQWENPLPGGLTPQTRYWIDDIYMIGSLQIQAYRVTGEKKYIERAALEIASYLQKLQQPNGLFFHGENAPFHWGRGNGWVAAGLAELISELPKSNKHYQFIHDSYVKMMKSLLQYQADDGMWRQLIDHENSWKETSSTAMFGYAMTIGVKKGILKDPAFTNAYQRAWLSLVNYMNDKGELSDVCVGTGQSTDVQYYLDRGKVTGDLHAQAPMLWFAFSIMNEY